MFSTEILVTQKEMIGFTNLLAGTSSAGIGEDVPFRIYLISFSIGLALGLIAIFYFSIRHKLEKKKLRKEIDRQKQMLHDRLEVEMETTVAQKEKIKNLQEENSNLQQSLQSLSQKATRLELQQLAVYQKAVDILSAQSPGFAPAWQNALKTANEEVEQYTKGVKPFIRNIVKGILPENQE